MIAICMLFFCLFVFVVLWTLYRLRAVYYLTSFVLKHWLCPLRLYPQSHIQMQTSVAAKPLLYYTQICVGTKSVRGMMTILLHLIVWNDSIFSTGALRPGAKKCGAVIWGIGKPCPPFPVIITQLAMFFSLSPYIECFESRTLSLRCRFVAWKPYRGWDIASRTVLASYFSW